MSQPSSGGVGLPSPGQHHHGHHQHHPVPNVYLSIQGVGLQSGFRQGFDVLCGPNPPTITGGYANWQTIPRYLQRGLTIFTGYDPIQMTLDVIFGVRVEEGWKHDRGTGHLVEGDIGKLEWMAGGNFGAGPSPLMYVFSHANDGTESSLVPELYKGMPWIVTTGGLQWGTSYRNKWGQRTWQEATVVLENFMNFTKAPQPDLFIKGSYFKSRAGRDTALTIASVPRERSPMVDHRLLARRILSDPKNNPIKGTSIRLARRSVSWQIKHGSDVFVPYHQVS